MNDNEKSVQVATITCKKCGKEFKIPIEKVRANSDFICKSCNEEELLKLVANAMAEAEKEYFEGDTKVSQTMISLVEGEARRSVEQSGIEFDYKTRRIIIHKDGDIDMLTFLPLIYKKIRANSVYQIWYNNKHTADVFYGSKLHSDESAIMNVGLPCNVKFVEPVTTVTVDININRDAGLEGGNNAK